MEALTARLSSTSATMGASADEGGCRGPPRDGTTRGSVRPAPRLCPAAMRVRAGLALPDGVRAFGEGHRSGERARFRPLTPHATGGASGSVPDDGGPPDRPGEGVHPHPGRDVARARGVQGGRRGGRTEVAKAYSAERRFDVPTGDRGIACLLDRWTGAGEPVLPRVERCLSCDAGKAGKATVCGSFWSKVMACGRPRLQACKPWPLRRLLG